MGSRVVSLTAAELSSFTQGNGVSINSQRTQKRTQRKGYDRYQLRRTLLRNKLDTLGMLPDDSLSYLPKLQLWGLRAKAVTQRIELNELGRVLLHLNQKRGYKSIKSDFSGDKKITDYVKTVKTRYDELKEMRLTIGELFFRRLTENAFFRCKEQVYPRQAYVEEFDCIMNCQRKFYPDILTDETKSGKTKRTFLQKRNGSKLAKTKRSKIDKRTVQKSTERTYFFGAFLLLCLFAISPKITNFKQ